VAVTAWWFRTPPEPLAVGADDVSRVVIQLAPWGDDAARAPAVSTEDREAVAALVAVVRSGRETTEHKCGSRGSVRFERSVGSPVEAAFLPGHHPEWYELRTGGNIYRVPRDEFVAAVRRVGVELPLE
jgi:hypothetical protein